MTTINEKDFIETVTLKGSQFSLLASSSSTEIIHHKLDHGTNWALRPEEGWDALEYLLILKGELRTVPKNKALPYLKAGDSFFKHPIDQSYTFEAIGETEFLYVSSLPVFHIYSQYVKKMYDLVNEIELKDGYTMNHCNRITRISMLLGKALGLDSKEMQLLNFGSFFHDVGKIRIPEDILKKPGKLTSDEWDIMKKHPTYGREILEESLIPIVAQSGRIAEQHHERYDGKGYPKGLSKDEISIQAYIIAVADSYDAMTTDRVYQERRSVDYAISELLRCRGTMYHPDVVDKFIELKETIIGVEKK